MLPKRTWFQRIVDTVQIWLHLRGGSGLANFIDRWGGPVQDPLPQLPPIPPSWSAEDTYPVKPLVFVNFDPTFHGNAARGIDVANEVAWPTTKYDVN